MRQLPLAIGTPSPRSFANLLPGDNALAIAHLQSFTGPSTPIFLWGPSGSGKTHLLQALVDRFEALGGLAGWFTAADAPPWAYDERWTLIVIDGCDSLDAEQQHAAFTLFVEAASLGTPVVAAGLVPPVDLAVREDLRSRLGWGHVFAIRPLVEADVRATLRREADERGLHFSDDVMDYLLTRFARDLKHLMALLDRLDEFSMATHRPITVPLLKRMLTEGAPPGGTEQSGKATVAGDETLNLCLFDLDETLLPFDSDHAWGEFITGLGWVDADAFRRGNDAFYAQYRAGALDIHAYIAFASEPLRRQSAADRERAQARFMAEVILPNLHASALDLVRDHQARGDLVALVTATNDFVTAPIARALGIADLIAVRLAHGPGGTITGLIDGTPSYREGKVTRVQEWLASQRPVPKTWSDFGQISVYSDSINDLPLLEQATDPVATNPSPALQAIALARGWRILELFAPAPP